MMTPLTKQDVTQILRGDKDLAGCDLSEIELWQHDFSAANLKNANLASKKPPVDDAQWYDQYAVGFRKGPIFEEANLKNAQLEQADLRKANFKKANLDSADLRRANLSKAVMRYANLANANLCGATLAGADLSKAVLSGAQFDEQTIWPERFDPKQQGAIRVASIP